MEKINEEILERISRIEKVAFTTDSCAVVLIILLAIGVFIGYFTNAIESNYLRLSVYSILLIILFWLAISLSLIFYKKMLAKKYQS